MRIAIIGAGAAGCFAALLAAECNMDVVIFEKNERIGKKLLVTGNGKCNLTNLDLNADCYESTNEHLLIDDLLKKFNAQSLIDFFDERGLKTYQKDGYVYPLSNQASSVVDFFRFQMERNNIHLLLNTKVNTVTHKDKYYITTDHNEYTADFVLITTGGKASPKTGSDGYGYKIAREFGHHIVQPMPALVPIICHENFFKAITGVRISSVVSYIDHGIKYCEKGELQLTEYGISGIPVFQLSIRLARLLKDNPIKCEIDFMPDLSKNCIEKYIWKCIHYYLDIGNNCMISDALSGLINKKLIQQIIKLSGKSLTDNISHVSQKDVCTIACNIKHFHVTAVDTKGFDHAQVTSGGIPVTEVSEDLESAYSSGLYFAGEILDVTGRCGGYNLQWSFTSAYLALKGIERKVNS